MSSYRTCLLWSVCAFHASTCFGGGDPPDAVAFIRHYVSAKSIWTLKDEEGDERIFSLSLPDAPVTVDIFPHLAKLERLTTLKDPYEKLTDDDLQHLPRLPQLQNLRLGSNHVTDEGLKHLAGMKELRQLMLHETKVRGPGLAHLKDSSKLQWLELGKQLDNSAMPHIVQNFKQLRRIDFPNSKVTADGLLQLAELHWLTTIGPPDEIAGSRNDPNAIERRRELFSKYVKAYKASKATARAAGEDVPPDHIGPFGLAE